MSKTVNVYGKVGNFNLQNSDLPDQPNKRKNFLFKLPEPVSSFGGRENELSELHKSFLDYRIVVLTGMPAIGKSELAKKYASIYIEHYESNIIWINSEINDNITKSFEEVAKELSLKWENRSIILILQDIYQYFKGSKVLIIFDNVIDETSIKSYLPPRLLENFNISIIITSHYRKWNSKVKIIELLPFSEDESINLFAFILEEKFHDSKREIWAKLARLLNFSPLFLQISAAYILEESDGINPDFTIPNFIEKLQKEEHLIIDNPFPEYDNKTSIAAMQLALGKIKNKLSLQLMYVSSFLDPDYIDTKTILKVLNAPSMDDNNVSNAIRNISRLSLINLSKNKKRIRIHRLVQLIVQYYLKKHDTRGEYYEKALSLVVKEDDLCLHRRSVFQHAEKEENFEIVVKYYKKNKSFNFLRLLTSYGCTRILKILFNKMSKIRIKWMLKKHPLLYEAASSGNLDTLKLIYKYSKDVNRKNVLGWTPLRAAVEGGHEDITNFLLENGASVTKKDNSKITQLHEAAGSGNLEILRFIIDKAKDIDVRDADGYTPLIYALLSGHIEAIRLLIEKGAKVNIRDSCNRITLHYAAEKNDAESVEVLLNQRNIDLDVQDKNGLTSLHDSAIGGYSIVASLLIRHGASVNIKDKEGMTPLHWAAYKEHSEVVRLLLESKNIILREKNKENQTVLHYAAIAGPIEIFDMLTNKGFSINVRDGKGMSPFHYAVLWKRFELVRYLLNRYPDIVKQIDDDGQSALHLAARTRTDNTRIARLLLAKGSDMSLKDFFMRTPLDVAYLEDNENMQALLKDLLEKRALWKRIIDEIL